MAVVTRESRPAARDARGSVLARLEPTAVGPARVVTLECAALRAGGDADAQLVRTGLGR